MEPWISPMGSTAEEARAKRMLNPEYRAAHLAMRVAHDIADTVILGRGKMNWTQARLAREIGTTASVISRLESGQHKVSVETLRRLANALNVTFTIGPDPS